MTTSGEQDESLSRANANCSPLSTELEQIGPHKGHAGEDEISSEASCSSEETAPNNEQSCAVPVESEDVVLGPLPAQEKTVEVAPGFLSLPEKQEDVVLEPLPESEKSEDASTRSFSRSQIGMLVCLFASSLLAGCCTVIQAPFFTHEAHVRGLSSAASASVFSCFALAQLLAFPAMGWLAPRLGVTRLYRLALLAAGVTTAAFGALAHVQRPATFLACSLAVRAAEAVGTAAAQTTARTIVINRFPERMNTVMSMVEGAIGAGLCLGPALGGGMYSLGGYGAPFYTLGGLLLATAAASLPLMPAVTDGSADGAEKEGARHEYRAMLRLVLSTADNWLIFAVLILLAANWTAMDPSMEPYVRETLGLQPEQLSLFFLGSFAGYALSSPLWGRLSDAVDNTFLLVAGCLAPTALGVLLIPPSPLLGLGPSRLLLGLGMTLREVFQLGGYLPLLPLMVRRSSARGLPSGVRSQALVAAAFGAAYSLGNVLGPVGGGLVTDLCGYPTLATWLAGATATLCLAMASRGVLYQYHVARDVQPTQ